MLSLWLKEGDGQEMIGDMVQYPGSGYGIVFKPGHSSAQRDHLLLGAVLDKDYHLQYLRLLPRAATQEQREQFPERLDFEFKAPARLDILPTEIIETILGHLFPLDASESASLSLTSRSLREQALPLTRQHVKRQRLVSRAIEEIASGPSESSVPITLQSIRNYRLDKVKDILSEARTLADLPNSFQEQSEILIAVAGEMNSLADSEEHYLSAFGEILTSLEQMTGKAERWRAVPPSGLNEQGTWKRVMPPLASMNRVLSMFASMLEVYTRDDTRPNEAEDKPYRECVTDYFDRLYTLTEKISSPEGKNQLLTTTFDSYSPFASLMMLCRVWPVQTGAERFERLIEFLERNIDVLNDKAKRKGIAILMQAVSLAGEPVMMTDRIYRLCLISDQISDSFELSKALNVLESSNQKYLTKAVKSECFSLLCTKLESADTSAERVQFIEKTTLFVMSCWYRYSADAIPASDFHTLVDLVMKHRNAVPDSARKEGVFSLLLAMTSLPTIADKVTSFYKILRIISSVEEPEVRDKLINHLTEQGEDSLAFAEIKEHGLNNLSELIYQGSLQSDERNQLVGEVMLPVLASWCTENSGELSYQRLSQLTGSLLIAKDMLSDKVKWMAICRRLLPVMSSRSAPYHRETEVVIYQQLLGLADSITIRKWKKAAKNELMRFGIRRHGARANLNYLGPAGG